jgi:predicted nucleic acid-binding protein
MIVVSDTSSISNLLIIGEVHLLKLLFSTVVVPDAVYSELCRVPEHKNELQSLKWIERHNVTSIDLFEKLRDELDEGESQAIALAVELRADLLLIDEALGREVAESLGLAITGILGVLIRAKDAGYIPEVRPLIDRLIEDADFWIGESTINTALRLAGEK